jgi:hypothetical protein
MLLIAASPGCDFKSHSGPPPEYLELQKPLFEIDDPRLKRLPVVTFQLKPSEPETPARTDDKHLRGYEILQSKPLDGQVLDTTRGLLSDPDNFMSGGSCLEPGLAFRIGEGAKSVDVIICLACSMVYVYEAEHESAGDNEIASAGLTQRMLSQKGNAKLTTLYNELFVSE